MRDTAAVDPMSPRFQKQGPAPGARTVAIRMMTLPTDIYSPQDLGSRNVAVANAAPSAALASASARAEPREFHHQSLPVRRYHAIPRYSCTARSDACKCTAFVVQEACRAFLGSM